MLFFQTSIDILTTVVRNTKPPLSQLLICQAFPAVAQCSLNTDDNATMQVPQWGGGGRWHSGEGEDCRAVPVQERWHSLWGSPSCACQLLYQQPPRASATSSLYHESTVVQGLQWLFLIIRECGELQWERQQSGCFFYFSALEHVKKPTNQSPTTQKKPPKNPKQPNKRVMLFCPHNTPGSGRGYLQDHSQAQNSKSPPPLAAFCCTHLWGKGKANFLLIEPVVGWRESRESPTSVLPELCLLADLAMAWDLWSI